MQCYLKFFTLEYTAEIKFQNGFHFLLFRDMRCFFSCAIKKEASSISFGDASHAYVKLLYARERVEMQAGRRGKAQQTFEYRLEHKSPINHLKELQNVPTVAAALFRKPIPN